MRTFSILTETFFFCVFLKPWQPSFDEFCCGATLTAAAQKRKFEWKQTSINNLIYALKERLFLSLFCSPDTVMPLVHAFQCLLSGLFFSFALFLCRFLFFFFLSHTNFLVIATAFTWGGRCCFWPTQMHNPARVRHLVATLHKFAWSGRSWRFPNAWRHFIVRPWCFAGSKAAQSGCNHVTWLLAPSLCSLTFYLVTSWLLRFAAAFSTSRGHMVSNTHLHPKTFCPAPTCFLYVSFYSSLVYEMILKYV